MGHVHVISFLWAMVVVSKNNLDLFAIVIIMENFLFSTPVRSFVNVYIYFCSKQYVQYGYTTNLPADYNKLITLANIGARTIESVNNRKYAVGSVAQLLCK